MNFRMEADSIGAKQVPADAYYGVQSLRGCENFRITGLKLLQLRFSVTFMIDLEDQHFILFPVLSSPFLRLKSMKTERKR